MFKLHSPHNFIVGGGFFVRYSALPARLAWDAFGMNNGVAGYAALRRRVEQYRSEPVAVDPDIGCNVLNRPSFWGEADWIPVPATWAPNIVHGKGFATSEREGSVLWDAVMQRLAPPTANVAEEPQRFGADYLVDPAKFRPPA